jgi:ATP-dependent DNA helicase DinG
MQDLREIFGSEGPLARALGDYRPRDSQCEMAERVAGSLAAGDWLVVEAGTGTGKTFAYLVPALLSGKRVIVSTGTRTLQDQLFHRDLPLLGRVLGRSVTVALLKGRANYLCRDRLSRLPGELPLDGAATSLAASISNWTQTTVEGDLAELPGLPDGHPLRERLTSTRDSCTGSRCAQFSRCHVFAARRRANEAELVVVNHHLLLADLALKEEGYGDLLPSADALILDEAHQLPELAAQFFGVQFSSRRLDHLLADLPALMIQSGFDAGQLVKSETAVRESLRRVVQEVARVATGPARVAWDDRLSTVDAVAARLVASLSDLSDALRALNGGETLEQCAVRAADLAGELDAVLHATPGEGARLLSGSARGFGCQLVPFNVGPKFRAILQSRPAAWVFTSATLAVAGDFTHFINRMGLGDRCETLCIQSPFDYPRQALLYIPPGMPDPTSQEYASAVAQVSRELVERSHGGAFLLFTSHRALEAAARSLRAAWTQDQAPLYTLLVQGTAPREQLLREFREHGDAVLLGTSSFWEGVDVKGPALRLVVIDRLPFASPEDPVTRARLQHARDEGGNPFNDFQLPEAALALKQGVGRLIRSEEDAGVVVICDPRLLGRGYGRKLLASLPPLRRAKDLQEVERMFERIADRMPADSRA